MQFTLAAGRCRLPFPPRSPADSADRIWAVHWRARDHQGGGAPPHLWVFGGLALVFLFAAYFIYYKPEHQIHSYVLIVYLRDWPPLLLMLAALLGSFSLPTDIRQQTIHTILTKPVEKRLEIVIGRFLGFMVVMTAAIAVMSALASSTLRGVDPETRPPRGLCALVLVTGELVFEGAMILRKGTNVGEEWDYRGDISSKMPGKPMQYAIWSLPGVAVGPRRPRGFLRVDLQHLPHHQGVAEEGKGVLPHLPADLLLFAR